MKSVLDTPLITDDGLLAPRRLVLGRKALPLNREVICLYFFLTIAWVFRACLANFIEPWPLQPIPAAAIGQLIASDALATAMVTDM